MLLFKKVITYNFSIDNIYFNMERKYSVFSLENVVGYICYRSLMLSTRDFNLSYEVIRYICRVVMSILWQTLVYFHGGGNTSAVHCRLLTLWSWKIYWKHATYLVYFNKVTVSVLFPLFCPIPVYVDTILCILYAYKLDSCLIVYAYCLSQNIRAK